MNGKGDKGGRRRFGRYREDPSAGRDSRDMTWNKDGKKKDRPKYNKDGTFYERPQWVPPEVNNDPLPSLNCTYCGEAIKDLQSAVVEKGSNTVAHLDCIIAKLSQTETLEQGDVISYIGGGRFGIVHFNSKGRSPDSPAETPQNFTIKKIFEWEDREHRADWRLSIADRFSIT